MKKLNVILFCFLSTVMSQSLSLDFSGSVALEARYFSFDDSFQVSSTFAPELFWQSPSGNDSLTVNVFSRVDDTDDERTHIDLREFMWLHAADSWEFHAGVGKVFWGVTESSHLVDIINQTDGVESFDGEEKLGQAMIRLSTIHDWGVVDGFVLPAFRERAFSDESTRFGASIPINSEYSLYESGAEDKHVDLALRYSHSVRTWDVGLSYFVGTNRDPYLFLAANNEYLQPYYNQITQFGVDIQTAVEAVLWKLEAIARKDSIKDFAAVTAGFEYTQVGVFESNMDLGFLVELHKDSRKERAPTGAQNDAFLGLRLAVNDIQDTSVLAGISQDLDNGSSYVGLIEAQRRIGASWRLTLDALLVSSDNALDPLYQIKKNDHLSVNLEYYF